MAKAIVTCHLAAKQFNVPQKLDAKELVTEELSEK